MRIAGLAILTIVENHGDFVQLLHQIETIPIGPLLCLQMLYKLPYKVGVGLTEPHKKRKEGLLYNLKLGHGLLITLAPLLPVFALLFGRLLPFLSLRLRGNLRILNLILLICVNGTVLSNVSLQELARAFLKLRLFRRDLH